MFIELFQKGVRTVYRAIGAREVTLEWGGARVHAFRFDGPAGRPVVFLHGLGDASTTWYRIVRPLRERTTVVAIDLPPFGLSSLSSDPFLEPRAQADLVADTIRETLDEPVALVGQSMGGWVAQWVLHRHPGVVDRVALVSPAGARLPGSIEAIEVLTPETIEETIAYLDTLWYEPPAGIHLAAKPMLERLREPAVRDFLHAVTEDHLLAPDQLAAIDAPALVVWGSHDKLLDPGTPGFLAEHWGGPVERSYLARAGHMPHLERPRTLLGRLIDFTAVR